MKRFVVQLGLLLIVAHLAYSYNVLFMFPFGSKSHKNVFDPVAEELAKRGHKVVMFTTVNDKKNPPGVKNVYAEAMYNEINKLDFSFFQGSMSNTTVLANMFNLLYQMTEFMFSDPFIDDLVKQPIDPLTNKPKFDVLIMDAVFNDFSLAFGHHLGIPNIIISPSGLFYHQSWHLDIPHPLSYIPSTFSGFSEPMNFLERVQNTFTNMFLLLLMNNVVLPNEDAILQKFLPNTPPLTDLIKNVSFVISHTHPVINLRLPRMPYTVEVGGLNCKPAKPLPKDLEDFMQGAGEAGVIYFSLGSVTKGEMMPLEMRTKVIEAFSKLPQKILWKYEKDIPDLPKNIKLVQWAPQNDILGHPQTRLFITHGGLLSLNEAIYHGSPVLGFPLSADQYGNAVQVKRTAFGDYLDWKTFTSQELFEAIENIIKDKSYKEKAMALSTVLKDRPQNPAETAAYWVEYVIRHKGAHFLKSSAHHLNFFQYFLLDVIAAAIAVLIVVLIILFYVLKLSCRLLSTVCRSLGFCKASTTPKKSNKKKKTN